jgi:hypothetical protein
MALFLSDPGLGFEPSCHTLSHLLTATGAWIVIILWPRAAHSLGVLLQRHSTGLSDLYGYLADGARSYTSHLRGGRYTYEAAFIVSAGEVARTCWGLCRWGIRLGAMVARLRSRTAALSGGTPPSRPWPVHRACHLELSR